MSVFSDAGKTMSSVFRATRKAAEAAETVADETGKIVTNTGDIINGALSAAAEQGKMETELEMEEFKFEHAKRKAKFDKLLAKAA